VFDAKAKSASLSTSLFRPNLNAVGELEGLHWGGMMLLPSELPRRAPTSATAAVPKYPPFLASLVMTQLDPLTEASPTAIDAAAEAPTDDAACARFCNLEARRRPPSRHAVGESAAGVHRSSFGSPLWRVPIVAIHSD
jgi:hypothetical protein